MTRLCASIFVTGLDQAKRDISLAAEAGAEAIELRMDLAPDADLANTLCSFTNLPTIVTCRLISEGGESELDPQSRLEFLDHCEQASYVDIESTETQAPRRPFIASMHDFKGRPPRLHNHIAAMNVSSAAVNKIAWQTRSIRDNLEAFELLQQRQKPTIALCMGEAGLISRVLAKKFGAFLTFASLSKSEVTAPGQPTIHELKNLYRWDAIHPDTKVFGVVGSPVAHSLSPAIHNAAFAATETNAVYVPMLVEPGYESFKAFMETFVPFEGLHLSGLSITIPHKENALRYLESKGAEIDLIAQRCRAVNTIRIDHTVSRGAQLRGFNTDHNAILKTLGPALEGKRIAVLGAGGAARTAVAALADLGATIVIYNRTQDRAEQLAADFADVPGKVVAARWEKLCDSCCQIYINATPVGMWPNVDSSPLEGISPKWDDSTLAFDMIYNPRITKFLQQARDAGARVIGGEEMFLHQAALQYSIWTETPAPEAAMRAAFEASLAALTSE